MILEDKLSSEPISEAMGHGDEGWVDIVNWMLADLIKAEEIGVTQANVEEMTANPPNPTDARLLGVDPGMGGPYHLKRQACWVGEISVA